MNQLSLHLDSQLASDLSWATKVWLNTLDDDRWVRFSQAQPQQRRSTEEALRRAHFADLPAGRVLAP